MTGIPEEFYLPDGFLLSARLCLQRLLQAYTPCFIYARGGWVIFV